MNKSHNERSEKRCERLSLPVLVDRRSWKYKMLRHPNQQANRCVCVYMHPASIVLICYSALGVILPLLDHLRIFLALNLRAKLTRLARWYGCGNLASA